jgi:transposase-like protein
MTKKKQSTEAAVREIRRRTRRKFAPEEKVRIVLEGLRGEQSISELCRNASVSHRARSADFQLLVFIVDSVPIFSVDN